MHVVIPIANANANPSVCAPCGGKCCKTMPGAVFPQQLDTKQRQEIIHDKVLAMLETGRYTLDWYEGDPFDRSMRLRQVNRVLYLRPAIRGNEGRWTDEAYGGTCTFLGAAGCALSEADRPLECLALIPQAQSQCHKPEGWEVGGRRLAARAWWPLQHVLLQLEDQYWETVEVKSKYAEHL